MDQKINYVICKKDGFVINEGLKCFSEKHNCQLVKCLTKVEDVFTLCTDLVVDVVFIFNEDLSFDTMQNSIKMLKSAFPKLCLCLFTNESEKYSHCDYQFDFEEFYLKIYNILFNLTQSSSSDIDGFFIAPNKIVALLNILELQKKYKGYEYLKTAIEVVCKNKKEYFSNMSKLYLQLSKKYGVTPTSIERCIRLTINESSLYINPKKYEGTKYYSLSKAMENMCNGEFIRAVVTQLYEDMFV